MFTLWILSLDWELINNFLVLNSKTTQKHQKLWFIDQNPQISSKSTVFIKNCGFSSKSAVFIKIHSFYQNPQFLSKSGVSIKICGFHPKLPIFVKIRDFHENPQFLAFLSEISRGQHQIGILCETKDHLPRKVTPFYFYIVYPMDSFKTI